MHELIGCQNQDKNPSELYLDLHYDVNRGPVRFLLVPLQNQDYLRQRNNFRETCAAIQVQMW